MRYSRIFAIMLSLILMPGEGKGAQVTKPVLARKPEKQKVLFLTNSTFHAHGGCMIPFNGYCSEAGVHYEASGSYRHLEATREGKRISPYLAGQIEDQRILDLIKKGNFDYVVLVTRHGSLATDAGAKEEIAAFGKMHEHIVRSGAQTVVSVSYITRNATHDARRKARNLAKHRELKVALDKLEIKGKKHPIILVPTGVLWAEGAERFGVNTWFADSVHGTPLAQHASGCLFFTFITGKDPRKNVHVDLFSERRFPARKLSVQQAKWLRDQVWALYREQAEKKR